jgi:hypothetical protein
MRSICGRHAQTARVRSGRLGNAVGTWESPFHPPLVRKFRIFCAATGPAWNGLVQQVRGQDRVHPSAAQRLLNSAQEFHCDGTGV